MSPGLFIVHLALGGCLKAPPLDFGITADTGGHIAYVLEAAFAQSQRADVSRVVVATRLFEEADLPGEHAWPLERWVDALDIVRIETTRRRYLEKEALAVDLPDFTEGFCRYLAALPCLPAVVHAHFADAASVAAEARRRFGIPFVYTPHALGRDKAAVEGGERDTGGRIEREARALAAADAIVVSSRDEAVHQIGRYGVADAARRLHRIAPGVPGRLAGEGSGAIERELDAVLRDPRKPIVLAIARPVRKKNLANLVRAYACCPGLRNRANLVILAGQQGPRASPEEAAIGAELRDLCSDAGLHGLVALPDRHDAADVAALYARASRGGVFVNPALHEPFGLTLLEAAAAGVPVVATREGGAAEIVATIGHGLLIDPHDVAAIATACLDIVSDAERHRGFAEAGRRGSAAFDWRLYAATSVEVYRSIGPTPRLLVCDIDGTLTGCPSGAAAFAAWRAVPDLPFVVATGRSFDKARAVLADWGLPDPDAFIVDVGTRIMMPSGDREWSECEDFQSDLDEGWDRGRVLSVLAGLDLDPQPEITSGPHKVSFFGPDATATRIRRTLEAHGLAARVVHSHDRLIDVLAPRGGKAAAVAAYAARLGLRLEHCVAAGDSGNDADMLDACGRAIIVANAGPELAHVEPRAGLFRATRPHAGGVMEGLAAFGLAGAPAA